MESLPDIYSFGLPAAEVAGKLGDVLKERRIAVVTAPPGAGKSTLLPLSLLSCRSGKILMLEPRRLAARQIAQRMASMLCEPVGKTVGYRMRFETRVSAETRIEVVTEGILTRMLVEDPALEGIGTVIFDEFHERSLNSDVALALTREARGILREDLGIVIMSATIDASEICRSLDGVHIHGSGRTYPVSTANCSGEQQAKFCSPETIKGMKEATETNCADVTARTVRDVWKMHDGDILAFLPGEAEIRRCAELLGSISCDRRTSVHPLYGMLSQEEQRAAIAPSAPGKRKIVLATPIAETSITIEGVRAVVDSGLYRTTEFDPQSGLSRLVTRRISRDMADQRAGRAGRVAPGVCYRLWTAATESRMSECRTPEILEADLASAVLDISAWGEPHAENLQWITPPPRHSLSAAGKLLGDLVAIEDEKMTARGRLLSSIPCHPRIANMLVCAATGNGKALAADVAALLEERDPMEGSLSSDLSERVDALRKDRRKWRRIAQVSQQYRHMLKAEEDNSPCDPYEVGRLLAAAYPERIAHLRTGTSYTLASGGNAVLDLSDPMSGHEWISVASMNASSGRIFLCAPLGLGDLGAMASERETAGWDSRKGAVTARKELRIGSLVLESRNIEVPRDIAIREICEAVRREGLSMLDFSDEVGKLQRRVACAAEWHPELELPDMSTEALLESASTWLPPFIGKASSIAELKKIDLCSALWSGLSWEQQQAVERIVPSHITVPTGSRIKIEYRQGADLPVLRVRLQECFGLEDTPRVDEGRKPVLMELLSPGYKPVQLTSDLRSFWSDTYFEVRKELRRRYPKHSWPDNPLEAEAVRGVRKR